MPFDHTAVTATFNAGTTALGHHWELTDGDGAAIGRTEREYSGGALKRGLWRAVTVTGMDADNDIRARVIDTAGAVLARLFSHNEKDLRVEVSGPDGEPLAVVHRDRDVGFRYEAGGRVVATLPVPDRQATPWELLDADGTRVGLVDRVKAERAAGPSLLDYAVGLNTVTDNASDFQRTMHLGFAFSRTYSIVLAGRVETEPLRTLAGLTPVILAYAY